ncbi:guanine nucleotide-binding protein G(I)/G(S)/G(O) subunit gamma-T2 isoform X2 [Camelus dromedarius]|uniref:guanine nucleotide-binding protein G(I)/G(S)/G(O) subunit gamma-T2 isoform X2 n=1 Tax=Camelus dromedarius TaxID=9838 RepID=UPI001262FCA7|nr:guanine nucleotide-binding protein G(I)/G(S)/G(O) subunit gamma-T2 isoform X1 [Camelus dromedarius]
MISLSIRDLGFQTICFIQRFSAHEELGGSNSILCASGTSDLKCTLFLGRTRSLQGRMAQELSEKEILKMEVEQLKKEVKNPRALISKTGKEIKDYVEAEAGNDPLLKGIPEDKNPFKEKGGCMIS